MVTNCRQCKLICARWQLRGADMVEWSIHLFVWSNSVVVATRCRFCLLQLQCMVRDCSSPVRNSMVLSLRAFFWESKRKNRPHSPLRGEGHVNLQNIGDKRAGQSAKKRATPYRVHLSPPVEHNSFSKTHILQGVLCGVTGSIVELEVLIL